jgi:hypothetical protein
MEYMMEYAMMDHLLKAKNAKYAKYVSLEYRIVKLLKEREKTFRNRRLSMIREEDEKEDRKKEEKYKREKIQTSREDDLAYFNSQLNMW